MKWKRQINADNCNAALIDSIGLQRMKYISCVHNFDAFDDQCLAFDHRRRSRAIAIMFCHVPFNVLPFHLFRFTGFICCFKTSVVWRWVTRGARQNDVGQRRLTTSYTGCTSVWRWTASLTSTHAKGGALKVNDASWLPNTPPPIARWQRYQWKTRRHSQPGVLIAITWWQNLMVYTT